MHHPRGICRNITEWPVKGRKGFQPLVTAPVTLSNEPSASVGRRGRWADSRSGRSNRAAHYATRAGPKKAPCPCAVRLESSEERNKRVDSLELDQNKKIEAKFSKTKAKTNKLSVVVRLAFLRRREIS